MPIRSKAAQDPEEEADEPLILVGHMGEVDELVKIRGSVHPSWGRVDAPRAGEVLKPLDQGEIKAPKREVEAS